MPAPRVLLDLYLNLAQASEEQHRPLQRDKFLVLAAGIAQQAGMVAIAEDCRRRILRHNPTHILKAYPSMVEAMRSEDVRQYARQLLRVYPFEKAEYLLHKFRASGLVCRHAFGELLTEEPGPVAETRRRVDPNSGRVASAMPTPAHSETRTTNRQKVDGTGAERASRSLPGAAAPLPFQLPYASPSESVSYWSLAAWIVFSFAIGAVVGGFVTALLMPLE